MGKKQQVKVVPIERPCGKWIPKNENHGSSRNKPNMDLSKMLNLQRSRSRDPLKGMEYLSQPVEVTSTRQTKLNSFFKKTAVTVPDKRARNPPNILLEDSSDVDLPLGLTRSNKDGPELRQDDANLATKMDANRKQCRNERSNDTGFTLRLPEIPLHDTSDEEIVCVKQSPVLQTRGLHSRPRKRKREVKTLPGSSAFDMYPQSGSSSDGRSQPDNKTLLELDPNIFGSPEYDATVLKQTSRLMREDAPNSEHILDRMRTGRRVETKKNSGDKIVHESCVYEQSKHKCKQHIESTLSGSTQSDFSVESSLSFTQRLHQKRENFKNVMTNFDKDLEHVEKVAGHSNKRPRKSSAEVSADSEPLTFHMPDSQEYTKDDSSVTPSGDTMYTFHERTAVGKSTKEERTQDSSPENYTFHVKPNTRRTSKHDKSDNFLQGDEYTFHARPEPIEWSDEEYTFHAKPGQGASASDSDRTQFSQNDDDFSPLTFH